MSNIDQSEQNDNVFWRRAFFSDDKAAHPLRRMRNDLTARTPHHEKIGDVGELWLAQLFASKHPKQNADDKMRIFKSGVVIYEIPLQQLKQETVIGRHPDADLQLESQKIAMFHAVILKKKWEVLY